MNDPDYCRSGHRKTAENWIIRHDSRKPGQGQCRLCRYERDRKTKAAARARKRAEKAAQTPRPVFVAPPDYVEASCTQIENDKRWIAEPPPGHNNNAKFRAQCRNLCAHCPVLKNCARYVLATPNIPRFGIYAGVFIGENNAGNRVALKAVAS